MKKSKFVLATLAAAVFATSAAGIAACSKSNGGEDEEYTITFDANGSYFGTDTTATTKEVETIAGLALQPTPAVRSDGYTFNGYTFTKDGTDTVETTYVYTDSITVYASWSLNGGGGQQQNPTGVFTITLDANGGTLGAISSVQTSGGKLTALPVAPTPPANKQFKGWFSAATGGSEITTDTVFTVATTIFAQWDDVGGQQQQNPTGVYTINLNANGGTSSVASVQTSGGKLTTLPPAPSHPDSKPFNGWFDAPSGGNQITTNTSFNGTTTIYAQWGNNGGGGGQQQTKANGIYVGDTMKAALVENPNGLNCAPGVKVEYWLGGGKVSLTEGETVEIYIDNTKVEAYVETSTYGVDKTDTSNELSSFSVIQTGQFEIYLHENFESGQHKDWSVQFSTPVPAGTVSEAEVANCARCTVTFTSGGASSTITFVLKDSSGYVTDLSRYKLYTFSPSYGEWNESKFMTEDITINGVLSSDTGFIFRWSPWDGDAAKTGDIKIANVQSGATYLIELKAANAGSASDIKKVV